jgi:cysteinyl-tRNA synthetase
LSAEFDGGNNNEDGEKQMTITADYVLQGVNPQQIATAPFDVQVVETANDDGVPFTAAQVKQMESGGSQVLGYFSLGEAEN